MAYYPDPNSHADDSTDTTFSGRPIFRQLIYPVYYMLYGEASDERINLDSESSPELDHRKMN